MTESKDTFLKSIAILLTVTLTLALAALYALRPRVSATDSPKAVTIGATLGPVAGDLKRLSVHTPESDTSIAATPVPGIFTLDFKNGPSSGIAASSRADALIRVLFETKITKFDAPPTAAGTSWIEFGSGTDTSRRITLSTQPGPKWVAQIDSPPSAYVADRDLTPLLTRASLQQLADTHLAPGLNERTSEILIDSAGVSVHLVRTPSSWALSVPISAPADRNTAETSRIVLTDFPGAEVLWDKAATDQSLGFASPRAVISASMPLGDGSGETQSYLVKITLGADADVAGDNVYGLITGSIGTTQTIGPYVVKIAKATLNRIPLAPSEYIARTAITLEPSDIRSVSIGPFGESGGHHFTLSASGWSRDGTALDASRAADIAKLITLLTTSRADTVSLSPKPMMGLYSLSVGPKDAPNRAVVSIGKSANSWWIQNSYGELRFKSAAELGELLERLAH